MRISTLFWLLVPLSIPAFAELPTSCIEPGDYKITAGPDNFKLSRIRISRLPQDMCIKFEYFHAPTERWMAMSGCFESKPADNWKWIFNDDRDKADEVLQVHELWPRKDIRLVFLRANPGTRYVTRRILGIAASSQEAEGGCILTWTAGMRYNTSFFSYQRISEKELEILDSTGLKTTTPTEVAPRNGTGG